MEVKLKVKFINNLGVPKSKIVSYKLDRFFEDRMVHNILGKGIKPFVILKEEAILEYLLHEKNFVESFLDDDHNDCYMVLDCFVYVKKEKTKDSDKLKEFVKLLDNEQMQIDFLVIYNEMKDSLNGLSFNNKIKIVTDALALSYKSSTTSYNAINDIFNKSKNNLLQ